MESLTNRVPRRPWRLWFFSLIIAGLGVYNLALALDHMRHAGHYRALGVSYPPLLRAVLALAWGVLLVVLAARLARRQRTAYRWSWLILSNYGAFGVLWMLVFTRSDFGRERIAFQAVLTALLLVIAGGVLRWRPVRTAFPTDGTARVETSEARITKAERHTGEHYL